MVRSTLCLCIALTLAACGPAGMTSPTSAPDAPAVEGGYPAPATGGEPQGYPGAETAFAARPPGEPLEPPTPSAGLASVSGVLVARDPLSAIAGMSLYVTRGEGEDGRLPPEYLNGPDPARGDVSATTDESGRFVLNDIPPGVYYLFVWAPMSWREAEMSETDQRPMQIELAADQRVGLGQIFVSWP